MRLNFESFFVLIAALRLELVSTASVATETKGGAQETQHAFCEIMTEEIKATANATITRELKGVCTLSQLSAIVAELEAKIMQELSGIKAILGAQPVFKTAGRTSRNLLEQVENLNGTTLDGVFVYFWKIQEVLTLLAKREVYVSSPEFLIFGHSLHIQLFPHHLDTDLIGLQLRAPNGFIKKHRLTILDFSSREDDLVSEILGDVLVTNRPWIFKVGPEELRSSKYVFENSMIVKIEIFLDS